MSKSPPKLSIVAPCYNEQDGIEEFHRRISAAAKAVAGKNYELIIVNDGSRDATWSVMCRLVTHDPRLVLVNLSRRHGHQLALTAGLGLCRGDRVLTIDSDLQDPPELLAEMWRLMDNERVDVVYGLRNERLGETRFKRSTAALFYWLLQRVGDANIPSNAGDFRLMTRRVVDILKAMPEQHRFIRGMISWIGFRQIALQYDRNPRFAGSSQYPLSRMMILALDALTGFSTAPLRIAAYAGTLVGVLGLFMLVYTLGSWVAGRVVDGWTSLTTIVLILGSLQLILFGVLGEYVGRLYIESKRRPLFTIDRIVTFNAESQVTGQVGQLKASYEKNHDPTSAVSAGGRFLF
jgi:glycosyltransferase involved in cell wall biosynthesis